MRIDVAKGVMPNPKLVWDFVRRQGNEYCRRHKELFAVSAVASSNAKMGLHQWVLRICKPGSKLAQFDSASISFVEVPGNNSLRDFIKRLADVAFDRHYLQRVNPAWSHTLKGKKILAKHDATLYDDFERFILEQFDAAMPAIELAWMIPPKAKVRRPKPKTKPKTVVERRAVQANTMLSRWERRAKLAKTKVAHYRKRVRYYQGRAVK